MRVIREIGLGATTENSKGLLLATHLEFILTVLYMVPGLELRSGNCTRQSLGSLNSHSAPIRL